MRTHIATDLHDDIGSNLTKIAILSEVARQRYGQESNDSGDPLATIARISRESVSAMSDIVWAINPNRDSLLDLVRRMRQFAEEHLQTSDIVLRFHAPATEPLNLGADVRRQVYLIFKEAINNIVRHAQATTTEVELKIEGCWLGLRITDDGRGFDPAREYDGNGLLSMKKRAGRFGAELRIDSGHGNGTCLFLRLPLSSKRPPPRVNRWVTARRISIRLGRNG
jgi:signal transduction histidine kinase